MKNENENKLETENITHETVSQKTSQDMGFNENEIESWDDGSADDFIDIPARTSGIRRIIDTFVNPRKLAENIRYHQNIGAVILFIAIISLATTFFSQKNAAMILEQQSQSVRESYGDDVYLLWNQAQAEAAKMQNNDNAFIIIPLIVGAVSQVIGVLLINFIPSLFVFIIAKLFKAEITYLQTYVLLLHFACISVLGGLLSNIGMFALQSANDIFSLAFLSSGNLLDPMYYALSGITVFSVWRLIFITIGLSELGKISVVKAFIPAFIIFIANLGISMLSPQVLTFGLNQMVNVLEMGN